MNLVISKLTAKSQTVIPLEIRKMLGLRPGDIIRYHLRGKKVEIEKLNLSEKSDDPFIEFSEWASKADSLAYDNL